MAKEKKKRLGRGLSSLIKGNNSKKEPKNPIEVPVATTPVVEEIKGKPLEVDINTIQANPYQPRKEFNKSDLEELTLSIKNDGVIQPLIIVKSPEGADLEYTLIAGERRLRASKDAGLKTVPCIVKQADEKQMVEWAIIENIQRSDLNPLERAVAYKDYMDRFNLSQKQVANQMGQSRASIANHLRIIDLSDEVKQLIATELLSFGHAKILASLTGCENEGRQVSLARRAVAEGLSVRKLEALVSQKAITEENAPVSKKAKKEKSPHVKDIEQKISEITGTRVDIMPGKAKNTGKIVIEYYNLDDFDRISNVIGLDIND